MKNFLRIRLFGLSLVGCLSVVILALVLFLFPPNVSSTYAGIRPHKSDLEKTMCISHSPFTLCYHMATSYLDKGMIDEAISEYKKELESLKESIAEKDIESTVKSLVLTISTLKRSMASLKKQTQELKRELERKKPESEELKKLSSLESIVKGHDSAIREISESIMKMEKAPESLSKETERNTDYLFTKLYNALNSGDVVEAKKIYLKIHKIYEKLPPEDSKCDELYAKLSQAYEMIRKAEGIKSEA